MPRTGGKQSAGIFQGSRILFLNNSWRALGFEWIACSILMNLGPIMMAGNGEFDSGKGRGCTYMSYDATCQFGLARIPSRCPYEEHAS